MDFKMWTFLLSGFVLLWTGSMAGKVEKTGSKAGKVEKTGSMAGKVEKTGSMAGKVEKTGSMAGKVEKTGSKAGKVEKTGSKAGKVEKTRSMAVDQFCTQGFLAAGVLYDCWKQEKLKDPYPGLHEKRRNMNGDFLGKYANYMCSRIKPKALGCFKEQMSDCPNHAQLVELADHSGGACEGAKLSPYFRKHVSDRVETVNEDEYNNCLTVCSRSYKKCYYAAGIKILNSGMTDDIDHFHTVADMFFDAYWDCMIDLFKSHSKTCVHWQMPMLMTVQQTALPTLFCMKLKKEQMTKLELERPRPGTILNETETKPCDKDKDNDLKVTLSLQLLPDKRSNGSKLLIELSDLNSNEPKIRLNGVTNPIEVKRMTQFLQIITSETDTLATLKQRRRLRNNERKESRKLAAVYDELLEHNAGTIK